MSSESSTEERQVETPTEGMKEEPKFLKLPTSLAIRILAGVMFCLGIIWVTSNTALGEFSIVETIFSVLLMLAFVYLYIAAYLKSPRHLSVVSIVLSMLVLAWTVVESVAFATFDWQMQTAVANAELADGQTPSSVEQTKAGPIASVVIAIILNLSATGLAIFLTRSYRNWLSSSASQ